MKKSTPKKTVQAASGDKLFTFRIDDQTLQDVYAVAYWERITVKELMTTAANDYLNKYKKANGGKINPIPKK